MLSFALGLSQAHADIQLPQKTSSRGERQLQHRTPPPPSPVATTVHVQPGGSAEIVLEADGALGKTISFILRTPPSHGAFVGEPRRVSRDSVAVTYVHRAADGPGRDTFTFAAQAPGTAVSAAEAVDIQIAEQAPAAVVPAGAPDLAARPSELDFGAVENGSSTGATLTLENRGAGLATGRLDPPAPWVVDGEANYSLGPGARETFRFLFRPRAEGAFAETLRVDAGGNFNSTAGCIVRLVGTGLPAKAREQLTLPTPDALPPAVAPVASVVAATPVPVLAAAPLATSVADTADPRLAVTNEARVAEVKLVGVGASTVELAWKPPVPLPSSYRVERRSFARDSRVAGQVRTDWLPYERVSFRVRTDQVKATLSGFVAGEPVTLRVVSVDPAGRLSPPSPIVNATTVPGSGWWYLTPLRGLLLLLAGCVGLLARRRWRERATLRELDARHLADDPPVIVAR